MVNPHPDVVTDPLFRTGDFFDPHDLLQVKYEMPRRVRVDKQSMSQSASAFGFSRTFYQAEEDFQRDGVPGLLPGKRGPRQGHKLAPEVLDFAVQLRASDPCIRLLDLAAAIQKRFAITAIRAASSEHWAGRKKSNPVSLRRSRTESTQEAHSKGGGPGGRKVSSSTDGSSLKDGALRMRIHGLACAERGEQAAQIHAPGLVGPTTLLRSRGPGGLSLGNEPYG